MLNVLMCIFMLIWVGVAAAGLVSPVKLIASFPTVSKVLRFKRVRPTRSLVLCLRLFFGFFLVIGLTVCVNIVTGHVSF